MKVVERQLVPKRGSLDACEDGIVVTDHFAAVIDGATDKTGALFDGVTGGRYAMLVCADAIKTLDPDADVFTAVEWMTDQLSKRLPVGLSIEDRPTAVLAVYSTQRREIWRVGDVSLWHDRMTDGPDRLQKLVDFHAAGVRAAVIAAELANGRPADELRDDDVGRQVILPLLRRQAVFANNPDVGEWANGYGVINGRDVPPSFIERYPVPEDASTVVLATDGYPLALPTFKETEAYLQDRLSVDSLCVGPLRGTKGVQPGAESFDDRSYLRLAI